MLFTDESTVQLEQPGRLCFQKFLQPRRLKQRAKHPIKVHICGGISKRGATDVVIFTGIMDAERLVTIFEVGLLPFLRIIILMVIVCSRIMIPSMPATVLKNFLSNMVLIGGPHP